MFNKLKETMFKELKEPDIAVHACNPSTWEAEARELRIPGQPGL
jgi:hypothetical protein